MLECANYGGYKVDKMTSELSIATHQPQAQADGINRRQFILSNPGQIKEFYKYLDCI